MQAKLFQPFTQVDSSGTRRFSGTGLGLSIVRSLAEIMHGTAGFDSIEGRGSRFWFRIQAGLVDATDSGHALVQAPAPVGAARAQHAGYVMVVEDTPVNQAVIKALLGRRGHRIVCHENGRLAVDAIRAGEQPLLVLMDCQMPVMDGYDATAAIRAWERESGNARLPIVALTAGAFESDRQRCLAVGMDDFLTKPVEIAQLDAVLARWIKPGGN